MPISIPILTYHSLHAPGWQYKTNDHIALASDLSQLVALRYKIVPLRRLVEHLLDRRWPILNRGNWAAISFDDGTDHDFIDFYATGYGYLRSFFSILCDHQRVLSHSELPGPLATSFVIASPSARDTLDKTCIAGRGQWSSRWWYPALQSGLIDIGNHSWDHMHPSLPNFNQQDFSSIISMETAEYQITQAETFIADQTDGRHSKLFAYPQGISNSFLTDVYFPSTSNPGILSAFTTEGKPAGAGSPVWKIPRFVCGEHWSSPDDFRSLLAKC